MSGLALACVVIGAFVIVTRAPLVFAPAATLTFYRSLFATVARVRLFGLFLGALGAALVVAGQDYEEIAAVVSLWAGWLLAAIAAVFLILPGPLSRGFVTLLDFIRNMDGSVPRGIGVIAVFFGALLLYIGIWVL